MEVYANEIGDKTPEEVAEYYAVFRERWEELPGAFPLFYPSLFFSGGEAFVGFEC